MTYEDLVKLINASGQTWSQWDLNLARQNPAFGAAVYTAKQDYANATNDSQRKAANAAAENARKLYGNYSGGGDGSKYVSLGIAPGNYQSDPIVESLAKEIKNYPDYSYTQKQPTFQGSDNISQSQQTPVYQNQYQDLLSNLLEQVQGYGGFQYKAAPEYQNQYQTQLDSLLGQVQNYAPFSWDKNTDPAYAAYAKQYRREGDRAAANALAQAAAATGGQASTAAVTAASQAGDYYAAQLADQIPQLYENAYQRYQNDYSRLADQLQQTQRAEQLDYAKFQDQLAQYNTDRAMDYDQWLQNYNILRSNLQEVQDAEQSDYARYLDQLEQYNADRDFRYNQYLDDLNQYNTDRDFDYNQYLNRYNMLQDAFDAYKDMDSTRYEQFLDQINFNENQNALQRDLENQAWEREQQLAAVQREEEEQAWNRAWKQASLEQEQANEAKDLYQKQVDAILSVGGTPSADLIAGSGYSNAYIQALENAYQQQAALKAGSSSSTSSSRSGTSSKSYSSTNEKPNLTWSQTLAQVKAGNLTPAVLAAYQYYMGEAYNKNGSGGMLTYGNLSPAAQAIADNFYNMKSPSLAANLPTIFSNRIQKALEQGTITQLEADYLVELLGL